LPLLELRVLPLFLDVSRLKIAVVGNGAAACRRLRLLEEAGAEEIAVYAAEPAAGLAAEAGRRLERRWPSRGDLARAQLAFVADAPAEVRRELSRAARLLGVIVHVEDEPGLSDAQMPAVLHRGALTLAVSTGGASPALAQRLRDYLGGVFGPEWRGRIEEMSRQRRAWRAAGIAPGQIAELTGEWMSQRGWLNSAARH
jgi:precorrin-2 dehydrogenase / sirohydrochlorin ferrochelatase